VPIWKKEHYVNGDSGWVNCERCAAPSEHTHDHAHHHHHEDKPSVKADYSRQVALKEVGAAGQAKLRASKILVVGCGGLGVPVLQYLAGAGVGKIGLVDGDKLEASNLHRQTMYALADIGEYKAVLAAERVRALNPEVDARAHTVRLTAENASDLVAEYDLVIDCTDNFSTKFLLNDVCVRLRKPAIFSSVYQYEGQLQVVRPDRNGACLRCVWPEATRDGLVGNCAEAGVLGPVPGVFGCLQALEALKTILDLRGQLGDELLVLDLMTMSSSRVRIRRSESCPDHASSRVVRTQSVRPLEVDSVDVPGAQIIDIREPAELAETPTPWDRARHIPMANLLHGAAGKELSPTGKYVLVCASGRRSLAATEELRGRGFDEVYSLRGGVNALARRPVT
jgi:adenylyltransferase/sulfurtransferase